MPPAAKKDCSVILFDLSASQSAKQALLKICGHTYAAASKDLTRLILLNSEASQNKLNAELGGFNHILEATEDVVTYNPKPLLKKIDEAERSEGANWLEGLLVAVKNLEDFEGIGGIITYQVLFLTDFNSPLGDYNEKLVDKIVKGLNQFNAFLYVVGPNVEPPFQIKAQKDVRNWMKNLKTDSENLKVLNKIISNTSNSLVCDYKLGVHLFFACRSWGGTQPWNVPLGIGSKIRVPAKTMKILNDDVKIKLVSTRGAIRESVWIDAEDESIEIDPENVIPGIIRHEKFVQMPDNKLFQVENPRSFSVLCFTDSQNVPEYLLRGGGCYCVLPNGTPEKNGAFYALVDTLAKKNKYVIARRIYNNNYVPRIVALIPKPNNNPKCFILVPLPFGEDVRVGYNERKVESALKVETSSEVYNFLDELDVDGDKCVKKVPLSINMMHNRNSQRIVNKLINKALDAYMMLDELDLDLLEPPKGAGFEELKGMWGERELKEVKSKVEVADVDSDNDFDW